MTDNFKETMLQLLTEVDNVKAREVALQSEKARHEAQITQSSADLERTNDDLEKCREDALALRKQMDVLKNEIFARPDDAEAPVMDDVHTPTDGAPKPESEAKRAWREQAKLIRSAG